MTVIRLRVLALVLLLPLGACGGGASSTRPGPAITPTPRIVVAPPPAGFLSAPASGDRHTIVEWGWDGTRLRALHVGAVVDCCTTVFLSPDGTPLLLLDAGNGGEILDLSGRVMAHGPDVAGKWADDSRHFCLLRPHSH